MSQYTIRRPAQTRPDLRADPVVSRHRSLTTARAALARQRDGARKQGGYSRDYIADETAGTVLP